MVARTAVNSATFKVTTPSDLDIEMTRRFAAPRALVFEAMTKPEHVRRWWGILDEHHSVKTCEIDCRVGGAWRFIGQGPNGETEFYGVYREIAAPERLVYTEIFAMFPDVESLVTTVLKEDKGETLLTLTASYPTKEVRDMVMSSGMEYGAAVTYDRLEDLVIELSR